MSSHSFSVSGQRPINAQFNGGHVTGMSCPSRRSDAIEFQATGFAKVEIPIFGEVVLERRKVKRGDHVAEVLLLVIGNGEASNAGVTVYGHPVGDGEESGPENTRFDARKPGEQFGALSYYAEQEVVSSEVISAVVAPADE